jgi:hypothetical protein
MSPTKAELLAQLSPEQRARLPQMYIDSARRVLEDDARLTIQRWRYMADQEIARGNGAAAAQPWLDMAAVLERQLPATPPVPDSGVVAEA